MLNIAILTATTFLLAPAQTDSAAREYAGSVGGAYCETALSLPDLSLIHRTGDTAPLGGAWWFVRRDASYELLAFFAAPTELQLQAGNGDLPDFELHTTLGAVAITVPADAAEGATYLLRNLQNPGEGRVLTVGPAGESRSTLVSEVTFASAPPTASTDCYADCDDGQTYNVSGQPGLELTFVGGPAIVDVTRLDGLGGDPAFELENLSFVDSRWVDDASLGLRLVYTTETDDGDRAAVVRVEIRHPLTLEVLFAEQRALTWEPATFDFSDYPNCEDLYGDCEGCYDYEPTYCGAAGGEVPFVLVAMLGGLLVRRRRAAPC